MRKLILATLFFTSSLSAACSHIIGGELFYDYLGNSQYRVTLKLYRNCDCVDCAAYGNPEYLSIFDNAGNLIMQPAMALPLTIDTASVLQPNACVLLPPFCDEIAVYQTSVLSLPAISGGYYIVYQRCCRSTDVVNLASNEGASYTAHIPDSSLANNSSPRFNNQLPVYLCANTPLFIDYSATDPDGDSLVYSLCNPLDGADQNSSCPDPSPAAGPGCPTVPPAPPYTPNQFVTPYSSSNFTNNPSDSNNLTINPQTGLLTGTANTIGFFDITVCVSEYRNGMFLSTVSHDFQYLIAQCSGTFTIPFQSSGLPCPYMDTLSFAARYGVVQADWTNTDSSVNVNGLTFVPHLFGEYTGTVTTDSGCVYVTPPVYIDSVCTPAGIIRAGSSVTGNFYIYPNPAYDNVMIANDNGIKGLLTLRDLTGRDLKNYKLTGANQQISISDLPGGVYLLVITSDNETVTEKLVKQ